LQTKNKQTNKQKNKKTNKNKNNYPGTKNNIIFKQNKKNPDYTPGIIIQVKSGIIIQTTFFSKKQQMYRQN